MSAFLPFPLWFRSYNAEDPVEAWLDGLLCLKAATTPSVAAGCPIPASCELY